MLRYRRYRDAAATYTLANGWRTGWCFRSRCGRPHRHYRWPSQHGLGVRVDPRIARQGHGPTLYKEWKLSAPAAGSGVSAGHRPRQILTLILQGGGNSCTSAGDFTHWTLVMQGPKANYTLFGDLVTVK
jgi:hypothetical protein